MSSLSKEKERWKKAGRREGTRRKGKCKANESHGENLEIPNLMSDRGQSELSSFLLLLSLFLAGRNELTVTIGGRVLGF